MNYVTYSNQAKIEFLGINENLIKSYGAVCDKTALSMSIGARGFSKCDIGIGITGIAGPSGGTETKPVGLVYIGICDKYRLEVHELRIPEHLPRIDIKYLASQNALNYLRLFINKYY
jgi:PncC family amidohydrolase